MSIISEKLPILKDPISGLMVITLALSSLINVWSFQDMVELPKVLSWFFGLGLICLLAVFIKNKRELVVPKPVLYISFLSILVLCVGTVLSYDALNSLVGFFPRYIGSLPYFSSWFVFLILLGYFTPKEKAAFVRVIIFLAGLIAILGLFQSFGILYYGGINDSLRSGAPSFLGNPNFSAMFVVCTIPLQIWYLYKSWGSKKFLYYFAIFSSSIISVVIFNSRGSYLGLGLALFICLAIFGFMRKYLAALVLAITIGVVIVTGFGFYQITRQNAVSEQSQSSSVSTESRWLVWDLSVDQINKTPWFGTGLGNFFLAFRANTSSALTSHEWFDDAHNAILQYAVTGGLLAVTLFIVLIGLCLYWLANKFFKEENFFAGFVIGSILVWLLVSSFTPLVSPHWLLLGLLLSLSYPNINYQDLGYLKSVTKIALVIIGLVLAVISVTMFVSEIYLWQAHGQIEYKNYDIAERYTKLSLKFNPFNSNSMLSLSKSLIEQGKNDELEFILKTYMEQHPNSAGVYISMSEYYINLYMNTKDIKYKTVAESMTEAMVNYNSNYVPQLQIAATNMSVLGQSKKAVKYAQRAVVMDSTSYAGWMMLGRLEYMQGNKTKALFCFRKAYDINPSFKFREALDYLDSQKTTDRLTVLDKF